ncbi:MAG TPA: N-acetyltransferase [Actinomycetota bacterium]
MSTDFVPDGFTPPDGLVAEAFVLEPLGPQHNEADHAAWMSSIEHIHASPGFSDDFDDDPDPWPRPMSLEENLSDLDQHAKDFQDRVGFTYTVLDPADRDVIGCVYLYPSPLDGGQRLLIMDLQEPRSAAFVSIVVVHGWTLPSRVGPVLR